MLEAPFSIDLFMPIYPTARRGDWAFHNQLMAADVGYWGQRYGARNVAFLTGPGNNGQSSWMSLMAVELESQEIGIRAAKGAVVILGLGMGWAAMNAALRHDVTRVTVIDIDRDVIGLFQEAAVLDQLPAPAREKITIVNADALTWRPDHAVDTLIADIWLKLVEPGKFDQARQMQENIQARQVYVWGQELEIWSHCRRRESGENPPDWPLIRTVARADIRLPLILPDFPDFGDRLVRMAESWARDTLPPGMGSTGLGHPG